MISSDAYGEESDASSGEKCVSLSGITRQLLSRCDRASAMVYDNISDRSADRTRGPVFARNFT